VIAAKAARMKCLAVPDVSQLQDPRFSIADKVISSLEKLASSEGYI
jgi:mannitol-1-/sugar-/sorbitol-6-/2-deoxyglucose-6-phosphatase